MGRMPVIGVTGPIRGGFTAWCMTALAIRRSGGKPLRIAPGRCVDESILHGLVIGGGSDVDPLHYGEEPCTSAENDQQNSILDWIIGLALGLTRILFSSHSVQNYDPERDALEQGLIRHALYNNKPVLGICRGAQLMNVTLGGSLHQRIDHYYAEGTGNIRSILPRKMVEIVNHTCLQGILQQHRSVVNALHDQSIKALGDGLKVSAREPSGVIQAIERPGQMLFMGVQWHPEYIPQSRLQLGLFQALVDNAREQIGN